MHKACRCWIWREVIFPHSQHLKLISNLLILLPANKLKVWFNIWASIIFGNPVDDWKKMEWRTHFSLLLCIGFLEENGSFLLKCRIYYAGISQKKGWGSDSDCQLFLTSKQDVLPPSTPGLHVIIKPFMLVPIYILVLAFFLKLFKYFSAKSW